ncbi:glutamate-5-semialdehyde dehydrogenase [Alteribacillus persepolensis]|uniref:Gamma-glutamyl phosphate reductase n=1 Tax=Alteribacillus persepolensis TaxID=568899 RepID=A0A1G7YCT9_9BACI|nr:glutamate-5-semialdehyde dehydrogenase [Alteribacillus persepolensis]SDG94321.1 glutamate-5-semialdehyde dehydrogenase [Alteribacillus persepolensis]
MGVIREQGQKAKAASEEMALLSTEEKNSLLHKMSECLLDDMDVILLENEKDLAQGEKNGLSAALLDRLRLTPDRIKGMANGFQQVASLKDPIGETIESWERPNGLQIDSIRVPLGVAGIIYEARPNVTADAAGLCIKTGNAAFLRGSSSAYYSNKAIVQSIHSALQAEGITTDAVQLAKDTSREAASEMFTMNDYLDVLIPRGGAGLIQAVVKQSSVPVLETGVGNCHVYIDDTADKDMGIAIAVNAKTQRPSVCNACETIVVHQSWFDQHGTELVRALLEKGVDIRGDQAVQHVHEQVKPATENDWKEEYLDLIVAVKTVEHAKEAVSHIKKYGTGHSEAIITETAENKQLFFRHIDAAALYHNASTRFTDGDEFGFGAEIGISTQKLHARGPMGLKALTSSKYIVVGSGQIKE